MAVGKASEKRSASPSCREGAAMLTCWHRNSPSPPRDTLALRMTSRSAYFYCFSGLHPHQTPAPMANPGLYPPPVSMPPGQPPPQQLLAPTYFSPPGVMNFGNPGYPYPPGALPPPPPPHLYSNTQVSHLHRVSVSFLSRSCRDPVVCGYILRFPGKQLGCSHGGRLFTVGLLPCLLCSYPGFRV